MVDVDVFSSGIGNIGIIPIFCSKLCFVREGNEPGSHEPPRMTAYFLFANSSSKSVAIGFTPALTSPLKNSNALTPLVLL
jgi:hypothetical protein